MDPDSLENDARAQVEATSEQGERAAATLLARLHGIAEQFAERTAPQLPTSLQQPARDHAVPTFVACVLLTLACAIGAPQARCSSLQRTPVPWGTLVSTHVCAFVVLEATCTAVAVPPAPLWPLREPV